MIGTTRSRVSFFMNKFPKLGFITYNGKIEVHNSLLNAVLYDKPEIKRDEGGGGAQGSERLEAPARCGEREITEDFAGVSNIDQQIRSSEEHAVSITAQS